MPQPEAADPEPNAWLFHVAEDRIVECLNGHLLRGRKGYSAFGAYWPLQGCSRDLHRYAWVSGEPLLLDVCGVCVDSGCKEGDGRPTFLLPGPRLFAGAAEQASDCLAQPA